MKSFKAELQGLQPAAVGTRLSGAELGGHLQAKALIAQQSVLGAGEVAKDRAVSCSRHGVECGGEVKVTQQPPDTGQGVGVQ